MKKLGSDNFPIIAGDLASPVNGDTWYNTILNKFRGRQAGANVDIIAIGASGGGAVAGVNTQIQFNNSGVFGGADVYYDSATKNLGVGLAARSEGGVENSLDVKGNLSAGANRNFLYYDINKTLQLSQYSGQSSPTNLVLYKQNTGVSDFVSMQDSESGGYIKIGSGGSYFVPYIKMSAGGSLNQYGGFLQYTTDPANYNEAALQFDARKTDGPLVNQDIASFSTYGMQKVSFSNSGNIKLLGSFELSNGLGSVGQIPAKKADGSMEWVTPATGGGSGTLTNLTATNNAGQTWTITNPTTTPNLSLSLTKDAVGLSNVPNTDFTSAVAANTAKISFDNTSSTRLAGTSGNNTGDNASNTQYANDYRAANFVAGTNYLVPTGNGSGLTSLTKTQVGLVNVDNTSDLAKPVSTAQQTALNLKANLASPTFTGTVTLPASQVINGVTLSTVSGTGNFLRGDGTYAAPTASAAPAGSTTQVQINVAGATSADAGFTFDPALQTLALLGTDADFSMRGITNEPATPAADTLTYYSKKVAGRMIPKIKGPSGLDTPMQEAFWGNNITLWNPSVATAGVWTNVVGATTSAGTYSVGLPTTTNKYTIQTRGRYANVVTTLNQILGIRHTSNPTIFLGNAVDQGGFFFFARMGFDVWTNGGRMFVGLTASTNGATVTADPSLTNNSVGFCIDAADNGAISFMMRGTAVTKTSTGITAASSRGYDVYMFAASNSTTVGYRIVDTVNGTESSGSVSVNFPTVNTNMVPNILASNAALTTATAIQIGINRNYIATDY